MVSEVAQAALLCPSLEVAQTVVVATRSIHVSTGSDSGRLRRPLVVMVEPTEDWKPDDVSTDLRDWPRRCEGRYPLKQPLMRTGTVEVGLDILSQYST